ncbi:MAG: hypothetical protein K2Q01_09510 [Rickettsiales bacterium]|nr:hypothetical protein [Rickettsiales bacterium]
MLNFYMPSQKGAKYDCPASLRRAMNEAAGFSQAASITYDISAKARRKLGPFKQMAIFT